MHIEVEQDGALDGSQMDLDGSRWIIGLSDHLAPALDNFAQPSRRILHRLSHHRFRHFEQDPFEPFFKIESI